MKNNSKSDFIRAQPPELSASEIVDKAKAAGIDLTAQLVYVVRSVARRKQPRRPRAGKVAPVAIATTSRSRRSSRDVARASESEGAGALSQQFLALVTDIGLLHAEKLLHAFRVEIGSIHLG